MNKKAFTLIELLMVIALIAILTAITIPAYQGISKGAAMRGAITGLKSTLMLSRQWAITHRVTVTVYCYRRVPTNEMPYDCYRVCEVDSKGYATLLIQKDERLPTGTVFNQGADGTPAGMTEINPGQERIFGFFDNEKLQNGERAWERDVSFNSVGGQAFITIDKEIELADLQAVARDPNNHPVAKIIVGWLTGSVRVEQ